MLYGVVGDDFVHSSAMDKDDVDDDDVLVEEIDVEPWLRLYKMVNSTLVPTKSTMTINANKINISSWLYNYTIRDSYIMRHMFEG